MRDKRAKALRRQIYGDLSLKPRGYRGAKGGTVYRDPLRQAYQKAKGRRGSFEPVDTESRVYIKAQRLAAKLTFRRAQAEARKAAKGVPS